jgi:hypothetical protein
MATAKNFTLEWQTDAWIETEKAIGIELCCGHSQFKMVWLPKSQIEIVDAGWCCETTGEVKFIEGRGWVDITEDGTCYDIFKMSEIRMPMWLARQKNYFEEFNYAG